MLLIAILLLKHKREKERERAGGMPNFNCFNVRFKSPKKYCCRLPYFHTTRAHIYTILYVYNEMLVIL